MNEHKKVHDLLPMAAARCLDAAEQQRVEQHLTRCEICRSELDLWMRLVGALKLLPMPMAPEKLVRKTRRLISIGAAVRDEHLRSALVPAFLILLSWIMTGLNWFLLKLFDIPLAEWLDVSSTTIWIAFMGGSWLAAALAAGMLAKHWHREGKTI
jgi:anti-sigma factor RsiW